jgi:mRNA interferase MazF
MREIRLAKLDRTRPVLVLTRELARLVMSKVSVAPITSTLKGMSSELRLGPANGLDHLCVASMDNIVTIPSALLGRVIGHVPEAQERELAKALILAFDLDATLFP